MNGNVWKVLRFEILRALSRKSFWFVMVGLPLLGLLALRLTVLQPQDSASLGHYLAPLMQSAPDRRPLALYDPAGVLAQSTIADQLRPVRSLSEGQRLIFSGEVRGLVAVAEDYLQTGEVIYYFDDLMPPLTLLGAVDEQFAGGLLSDPRRGARVRDPLGDMTVHVLDEQAPQSFDSPDYLIPYLLALIFYVTVLGNSSAMLANVQREKETRLVEVLLTGMSARDLLTGKMFSGVLLALGSLTGWMFSLWLGVQMGIYNRPAMFAGVTFTLKVQLWGLIFGLLAFFLYGSLLTALGALADVDREGSTMALIVTLPSMLPMMLLDILIRHPDSGIAVGFSLFPLTAPLTNVVRLAIGPVPAWQLGVALAGLLLSVALVLRGAARLFRPEILLGQDALTVRNLIRAMLARI